MIGIVGAAVSDRPIIPNAPSGKERVTRYDQAWKIKHTPLYYHTKRFFTPHFSPLPKDVARSGSVAEKQTHLLDGYIVWWVLAHRLGVRPPLTLLAGVLLLLATIASGFYLRKTVNALSSPENRVDA